MVGLNGPNSDSEKEFHRDYDAQKIYLPIYRCLIHNVRLQEKVLSGPTASRDVVITWFSHYVKLTSKSSAVPVSSSLYTSMCTILP